MEWRKKPEVKEKLRFNTIKHRYGLDKYSYLKILNKQHNKCAICKNSFEKFKPHVDHSHSSGKIRGLLCNNCNTILGHAQEKIETLRMAIKCLQKFS